MVTIKPVRLQRSRQRGARMHLLSPNGLPVIYVGRPTKYGNPWHISKVYSVQDCVNEHRMWMLGRHPRQHELPPPPELDGLRGKNLACWCALPKLGEPDWCHAAVLLELANV